MGGRTGGIDGNFSKDDGGKAVEVERGRELKE